MEWKTESRSSSGGFREGLWSKNFSNATPGCGVDPRFVPLSFHPFTGPLDTPHVRAYTHGCPAPARSAHQRDKHPCSASSSLFYCCRRVDRRVLIGVQAARRSTQARCRLLCSYSTPAHHLARGVFFLKREKTTRFSRCVLTFTHPHWGKGGSSSHTARGSPYLHILNRARVHFSGRERASPRFTAGESSCFWDLPGYSRVNPAASALHA